MAAHPQSVESLQGGIGSGEQANKRIAISSSPGTRTVTGERVGVRILTFQYSATQLPLDPVADIVLTWDTNARKGDYVVVHEEAVRPVCSPGYAAAHAETLKQPVKLWGDLTFLDIIRPNLGWASWEDWFRVVGRPQVSPRYRGFDSYAYLLQAAAAGDGIALGWIYFIERYLEDGTLIPLTEDFVEFGNRYCGYLTERGRSRAIAHQCLSFFEKCA